MTQKRGLKLYPDPGQVFSIFDSMMIETVRSLDPKSCPRSMHSSCQ